MMPRSLRQLAGACLLLCGLAAAPSARTIPANTAWAGHYVFDGAEGHTVGGSPITYHYELTIRPSAAKPAATLVLHGYQQDETILCNISGSPRSADISFASYRGGSGVNAYGVKPYSSGQALFRLTRSADRSSPLQTTWLALHPDATPNSGVYFRYTGR
ncbi:MAG TPA: DUF5991 domain-containing protein [Acetobacteraceae bacterium]